MYERLKALRLEKNSDPLFLANLLGLETKAAYYKKESGSIRFSLTEAKLLSDYFGLSIEDIFFTHEVSDTETFEGDEPDQTDTAKTAS